MRVKLAPVESDYPGALLPPVLQGIKAVVRQFGGIWMTVNAEDATVMFWVMLYHWWFIMASSRFSTLIRATIFPLFFAMRVT